MLAALHIGVRTAAQWGPDTFEPTIKRQVTGADAATFRQATRDQYQRLREETMRGESTDRAYAVEEGFRWPGPGSWSPTTATVDLLSAGPGEQGQKVRACTRVELSWAGGDWKVRAPLGGTWTSFPVTDRTGFTLFPRRKAVK